ncbi:hypothetical protein SUGI_0556360 [Cryptomeria japonica]|nr:hypothetical protein SUGI_0556360 [Cryptomeria japonica]
MAFSFTSKICSYQFLSSRYPHPQSGIIPSSVASNKGIKMWTVIAAAARGFSSNFCNNDPIDDGNLRPRLRAGDALNSSASINKHGSKIVSRGTGISPLLLLIPIIDCGLPCHDDINCDKSGPVPITELPSLRKWSQSSRNAYTSAGYLLVCFGVGIGIMSTIMSRRREMERLTCLLRPKEELKPGNIPARNCLETWQHSLGREQGQSDASLDALSNEACEVDDSTSGGEPENMTSVEAELEAEFEKLEFNLHFSNHHKKFLGINEIDPDCFVDVVNGEQSLKQNLKVVKLNCRQSN